MRRSARNQAEPVTPERWQQIKSTLSGALECEDAQQRVAFLDETCRDDADLRERVQTLLDQPDDEFDTFAETLGLTARESASSQRIGAYELIRELGRGGMGAVWLARRADQVFEKLVAIKILKRGTDTDEVLRRFDAERQILARLEHPNIARLLDAGTTDDDLPYFVMEYVDGRRLNDFVREEKLSLGTRLRLFLKICSAVQFAHQNLVVHRDLKPGNILITANGEPKLLDFGVAKLLAPGDEALLLTMPGEERFTPAYASPEQVRGEAITTLSDVYSAGALLYEILTGQNAHRFTTLHPPPTELLRVVTQEEPLRPSAVADDPAMKRALRGDLDNIILKALRKDPARRYSGMGRLAEDIQRHLENRPVTARADTLGYRAGKFIRRNKIGVAAAAVVLLSLIGGIIGIAIEARIANRRFNDVRQIAHSILFDYHDAIADLPGSTAVREKLAQDSLNYLDRLSREAGRKRSLEREIAAAYLKLGDVEGQPNFPNLGHAASALESYRKSLALWERLVSAQPNDAEAVAKLATVHSRLGELLRDKGDLNAALEHNRKAVALMEDVTKGGNASAEMREGLAFAYTTLADVLGNPFLGNVGDTVGAKNYYDRALQIREQLMAEDPTNPERRKWAAIAYERIAAFLNGKDSTAAMQYGQRALAISEALFREDPNNSFKQRQLALDNQYVSLIAADSGQIDSAKEYQVRNLELLEQLVRADPKNTTAQRSLAGGYARMSYLLARSGDLASAEASCRKGLDVAEPLLAADPENVALLLTVRGVHSRMTDGLLAAGEAERALPHAQRELELNEKMFALQPNNMNARRGQAATHAKLGSAYEQLLRWQSAREEFQQAISIFAELKSKGVLSAAETKKLDEAVGELAKCNAAIGQTPDMR